MTIDAVVRARMASTRLPGKALLRARGRTMLEHTVDRLERVRLLDRIVVATTTGEEDDAIAAECERLGVPCFRGSADDVLGRVAACAAAAGMRDVAHFGADNPLIDPAVCDEVLAVYAEGDWDYVTNNLPPTWPDGLEVEVTGVDVLETAAREATSPRQREFMLTFVWDNPERFRIRNVERSPNLHHERWTLDTPEDLVLVRAVLEDLPVDPPTPMAEILAYLDAHPEVRRANAGVGAYPWREL